MRDSSQKPPLLASKSLVVMTKFVAIYAAFHILTVIIKAYTDSQVENSTAINVYQTPIYIVAGLHLLMLLACTVMIMIKKYFWAVTVTCILISLYTRFYFEDIVTWINNY